MAKSEISDKLPMRGKELHQWIDKFAAEWGQGAETEMDRLAMYDVINEFQDEFITKVNKNNETWGGRMITVKVRNGLPHIDGKLCSYETEEIRSKIQEFAEVSEEFILPKKYTYVITELHGFAKIIKAPK